MKTIAIDLTSLDDNFSGIERYALAITKSLIEDPKNRYFLLFKNKVSHFDGFDFPSNVEAVILEGKRLPVLLFSIPHVLNKIRPDVALFFAFPPSFLKKLHRSIAVYVTIHDMVAYDVPKTMKFKSRIFFRLGYKAAAKRANKIFTVSDFSKSRIAAILHLPSERIVITPNGCSIKPVISKAEATAKYHLPAKYCLCLSTLEPRKNFAWLVREMCALWRSGKEYPDLVLVGRKGWKLDDLFQGIEPELLARIHLLGFIGDDDLCAIYSSASCFLFPSIYEGFGIPIIEAINSGALPLASDIPASMEILGGDYPYSYKLDDAADFEKKLRSILSVAPEEKAKMLKRLTEEVKRFTWEGSAKTILETVEHDL